VLPPISGDPLPSPSDAVDYVALGDSYSAGEGVPPFDSGTDTRKNRCHRSAHAYSRRFELPGYRFRRKFFACSQAVTDNLGRLDSAGEIQGQVQYPSEQLVQVQRLSLREWDAVDMVTLTVGGNDARFGPVLRTCLNPFSRCQSGKSARKITHHIKDKVPPKLAASYAAIAGHARNAAVFVLGYPQLFPDRPRSRCPIGKRALSRAKQVFLRQRGRQLNRIIRWKAAAAGFHFVNVERAFRGHEPCGPKSEWIHSVVPRKSVFSFHPNRAGQAAYARILQRYVLCLAERRWPFLPSGMPENPRGRLVPAACGT
jgi:lysophospholipase L1-like esterase